MLWNTGNWNINLNNLEICSLLHSILWNFGNRIMGKKAMKTNKIKCIDMENRNNENSNNEQ